MFKFFKQNHEIENNLYSKILFLSRNKIFYSDFGVLDTFQNRINLIFFHFSFLFNKEKINDTDKIHKIFVQTNSLQKIFFGICSLKVYIFF